jgi:hypothetical protein
VQGGIARALAVSMEKTAKVIFQRRYGDLSIVVASFAMRAVDINRRRPIDRHAAHDTPLVAAIADGLCAVSHVCPKSAHRRQTGAIPSWFTELSIAVLVGVPRPPNGFTYRLGNLIASVNATLQADVAIHYSNDYGFALALVAGIVVIVILAAIGVEAKSVKFGTVVARDADPVKRATR